LSKSVKRLAPTLFDKMIKQQKVTQNIGKRI
jgi:hypothetical protein